MNSLTRVTSAVLVALMIPVAAAAELRRVELKTLGMDWTVCAHAVRVAIGKIPGVESVDVSLERALTDVRLKPGNSITLPQLRQVIRNNGFNPKEATVTAVGSPIVRDGQPAFEVSGIRTVWLLAPDERYRAVYDDVAKRATAPPAPPVEIIGVVAAPEKSSDPERIAVQRVTPAAK